VRKLGVTVPHSGDGHTILSNKTRISRQTASAVSQEQTSGCLFYEKLTPPCPVFPREFSCAARTGETAVRAEGRTRRPRRRLRRRHVPGKAPPFAHRARCPWRCSLVLGRPPRPRAPMRPSVGRPLGFLGGRGGKGGTVIRGRREDLGCPR